MKMQVMSTGYRKEFHLIHLHSYVLGRVLSPLRDYTVIILGSLRALTAMISFHLTLNTGEGILIWRFCRTLLSYSYHIHLKVEILIASQSPLGTVRFYYIHTPNSITFQKHSNVKHLNT